MGGCVYARPVLASMADYITKARYWMAVLYPDRMLEGWQSNIGALLQVPYCYIIHDKDLRSDGVDRKVHVHVLIALGNTTTYAAALSIFKALQDPNKPSCIPNDEIRQVRYIRAVYDYFIHNTEECKKLGKHLYEPSERISGNCFDIGSYEQLGQAEKDAIILSVTDYIFDHSVENFADLILAIRDFGTEYFSIVKSNAGYFQALTKGMYLKGEKIRREQEARKQSYQLAITRHNKKKRRKNVE